MRALEAEAAGLAVDARDATQASGIAAERARLAHARLAAAERRAAAAAESGSTRCGRRGRRSRRRWPKRRGAGDGAGARLARAGGGARTAHAAARVGGRARREPGGGPARGAVAGSHEAVLRRPSWSSWPNEAAAAARAAASERDDLAERARATRERVLALERALAEREGLPPAARTLAEQGERIALAELDVEPGSGARGGGRARTHRLGAARGRPAGRAGAAGTGAGRRSRQPDRARGPRSEGDRRRRCPSCRWRSS